MHGGFHVLFIMAKFGDFAGARTFPDFFLLLVDNNLFWLPAKVFSQFSGLNNLPKYSNLANLVAFGTT